MDIGELHPPCLFLSFLPLMLVLLPLSESILFVLSEALQLLATAARTPFLSSSVPSSSSWQETKQHSRNISSCFIALFTLELKQIIGFFLQLFLWLTHWFQGWATTGTDSTFPAFRASTYRRNTTTYTTAHHKNFHRTTVQSWLHSNTAR